MEMTKPLFYKFFPVVFIAILFLPKTSGCVHAHAEADEAILPEFSK